MQGLKFLGEIFNRQQVYEDYSFVSQVLHLFGQDFDHGFSLTFLDKKPLTMASHLNATSVYQQLLFCSDRIWSLPSP